MRRHHPLSLLLLLATTVACREGGSSVAQADTPAAHGVVGAPRVPAAPVVTMTVQAALDSARADSARAARADSLRADSVARARAALDSTRADTAGRKAVAKAPKPAVRRPWPVGPAPREGALLPKTRIVAFYGNPITTKLGVLGRITDPTRMMDSLAAIARSWERADSTRTVTPALHLIASVASHHPGKDGHWRTRMSDSTIAKVVRWADERGWIVFVDLQVGTSTVQKELEWIKPWLARPNVHLALDPEFAMYRKPEGRRVPGKYIGTMDAADVNAAKDVLAQLVDSLGVPPKILLVHRFTDHMLTNAPQIELDPRVQIIIDMDGFGAPSLKKATWRRVILREPVQFTGWKLFYNPRNDKPMMKPAEVLELDPKPDYIQYQ
jgi:hypothetical protein